MAPGLLAGEGPGSRPPGPLVEQLRGRRAGEGKESRPPWASLPAHTSPTPGSGPATHRAWLQRYQGRARGCRLGRNPPHGDLSWPKETQLWEHYRMVSVRFGHPDKLHSVRRSRWVTVWSILWHTAGVVRGELPAQGHRPPWHRYAKATGSLSARSVCPLREPSPNPGGGTDPSAQLSGHPPLGHRAVPHSVRHRHGPRSRRPPRAVPRRLPSSAIRRP